MAKPFCQNPDCVNFNRSELEGQEKRLHDEDTDQETESKEYFGVWFFKSCRFNEAAAKHLMSALNAGRSAIS